tara:strand:+ start:987 stop:1451 length:465 start_codon:yes stop_codon:yes gene_type:complete
MSEKNLFQLMNDQNIFQIKSIHNINNDDFWAKWDYTYSNDMNYIIQNYINEKNLLKKKIKNLEDELDEKDELIEYYKNKKMKICHKKWFECYDFSKVNEYITKICEELKFNKNDLCECLKNIKKKICGKSLKKIMKNTNIKRKIIRDDIQQRLY